MDRRSWLWRRKSSEKSPGETESSGSISSHSERFSDEQAYAAHGSQSLEVTSKAVVADEDVSDRVKSLSERLSAALLDISTKEELVKQHAKVAEEAVSGWEKAENEVSVLKQQLESVTERNSSLESRVSHLDGALKGCLWQLRQSREEQEQMINDAVMEKTREWELVSSDLQLKLDAAERENSILKPELLSRMEELEVRTIELDLSTKAAETASKQNLESIKKVGKLEAEIRRLKAVARKAVSASSFCVESLTDSQSDAGEWILAVENSFRNEFSPISHAEPRTSNLVRGDDSLRNEKAVANSQSATGSTLEIDLMDDFLEMERLAGLPDVEAGSSALEAGATSEQFRLELHAMVNRNAELEEEIEKKEAEKAELDFALREFHERLDKSENCLKEAEMRLAELETQLLVVEELKGAGEEKMKATESQLRDAAAEMETLLDKIKLLEDELGLERAERAEKEEKCRTMAEEISRMRKEAELQQNAELQEVANSSEEIKLKQARELAAAASKFADCQKTIASLGLRLQSLANLDDLLVDSDQIPGLIDEEDSEHPGDGVDTNLNPQTRESEYSVPAEKVIEMGGTNPSRDQNVSSEKKRHGPRKFSSRGNKIGK